MSNHPNRSRRGEPAESPTPERVREWRQALGWSAARCGALVHTTGRVWYGWESGERRMHPAFWELARIKATATQIALGARLADADIGR